MSLVNFALQTYPEDYIAVRTASLTFIGMKGDSGVDGQTGEKGIKGVRGDNAIKGEKGDPGKSVK